MDDSEWLAILKEANESLDLSTLADALNQEELSPKVRFWISDILRRHRLSRHPGHQALPAWEKPKPTPRQEEIAAVLAEYQRHRADRRLHKQAIYFTHEKFPGFTKEALENITRRHRHSKSRDLERQS